MDKFKVQIVTPNRHFFDGEADMVVFKTTEGDIGVLKGHIPLTTTLVSGSMSIISDDKKLAAVIHGGFAEISADGVTILTDAAEWPDEIDLARAVAAKERAEAHMTHDDIHASEMRMYAAKISLMKALARIEAAEEHRSMLD